MHNSEIWSRIDAAFLAAPEEQGWDALEREVMAALAAKDAEIERLKLHHQTTADAARHTIRVLKEEIEGLKADNQSMAKQGGSIACAIAADMGNAKDSRISSLEADCALLGAECRARRMCDEDSEGGGVGDWHHENASIARKATDASPTASAWVKGTQ